MAATTSEMVNEAKASVRRLLDASNPESPLAKLRSEIVRDLATPHLESARTITEVRHHLAKQAELREVIDKSAAKGVSFEGAIGALLGQIALSAGDEYAAAGNETGAVPGSKVGDHIVTATGADGSRSRIVFESKNRRLTRPKAIAQLDEAADNRQAAVSVIVFKDELKSPARVPIAKLSPGRYAVACNPSGGEDITLRVAYQLARSDAVSACSDSHREFDAGFLNQKIREVEELLTGVKEIKAGIGTAFSGLDRANDSLQAMKGRIDAVLDEIRDALRPARGEPKGDK